MDFKLMHLVTFFVIFFCQVNSQYQYQFQRVVGGSPTTIDRYPIIAQLLLDSWGIQQFVQHCAGVILTSRHVISTAHCFQYNQNTGRNYTQPKYWKIRVGSSFRSNGGSLHNVKTIIPHEAFDKYTFLNDIALIVVSRPFKFSNNVRQGTITKHGSEIKPNSICILIGWGATEVNGPQPEQLQHTALYTIDNDICQNRYSMIGATVANSMMCAGKLDVGGVDGCFGDSGGPLLYKGLVAGLVSFGYSCAHEYYPGVYTKISHYTNWIVHKVNTNK